MKRTTTVWSLGLACLAIAALLGGCILSDQMTTLTIFPDGSADYVVIHSNVHSNELGAKAEQELARYEAEFNGQKTQDHLRIAEAGGQVQESRWIRGEPPYAHVIVARLPTAAALEKAFTMQDEKGQSLVTAHFTSDGSRRKFSLLVTLPPDHKVDEAAEPSLAELRLSQASGLSETRLAITGGKIVAARGFTVAGDKQSALLEPREILELLREHKQAELFLEWEVIP